MPHLTHPPARWLAVSLVLAALTACSGPKQAPGADPEPLATLLDKTVPVGDRVDLRIEGLQGSITIRTGKEGFLAVRVRGPARSQPQDETAPAMSLALTQDQGAVTLAPPRVWLGWLDWVPRRFRPAPSPDPVYLSLAVPEATNVTLREVSGEVVVSAIKGSVFLQGGQVEATLSDIGGEVAVQVEGGRVSVTGAGSGGACKFTLAGAALWGRKLSCQSLEATGQGDLRIEDTDVVGQASLLTKAGEIRLTRLRAGDLTGRVERGRVVLQDSTVQGGVVLENQNGDIVVSRANAGTLLATAARGNVDLTEVQGSLAINVPKGKAVLRRVLARPLDVRAGSAEVVLSGELLAPDGNRIQTDGGNVTLYLRRESSLRLQADAGTGSVIIDRALTPDAAGPVKGRSVQSLNGGAVVVDILTNGGDVLLKTGDPLF